MALTRRFFTNLARDYREARPPLDNEDPVPLAVWANMVTITANALASQNAMFNYERFYEACGLVPEYMSEEAG